MGSICRSEKGPTAIQMKLGWVLSGPTNTPIVVHAASCTVTTHLLQVDSQPTGVETTQLNEQVWAFWELESLGIVEEEKTLYNEFASTIHFQEGRYKVSLPWKEFHEPLGDNYQLRERCLKGLLKHLRHEPAVLRCCTTPQFKTSLGKESLSPSLQSPTASYTIFPTTE